MIYRLTQEAAAMGFLGQLLGPVMGFCYNLTKNYGLAIILFTFFSKIILLPISVWVQKNSITMVRIEPDVNRIKIKHFGDKDAIAEEQQKLYKKEKYNPLASLVPLIAQIVLLMGVVEVIYHPLDYILRVPAPVAKEMMNVTLNNVDFLDEESSSIQIYTVEDIQNGNEADYYQLQEQFPETDMNQIIDSCRNFHMKAFGIDLGWIASEVGGIALIAPLLAGLSSLLLAVAQNKINVLQSEQSNANKYGMLAFSVLLSLYLGMFVPAGVALYWVASNLFAIIQQYFMNMAINPAKYVDYEALESTRNELKSLSGGDKKLKFNDPLAKRAKADYKRFFSIENKHLVFYSESNGFYKYFKGMIEYILEYTNIPVHYITSDPNDQIFELAKTNDQIKPYFIDPITLITLMMKMDADVVVMTMPDLETYQIKRSYVRKDIEYINVSHGMGSLNLTFRKGALDHFDTVYASGKHQKEEIEKQEEYYHLPKKRIIEGGYPLLDDMRASYAKMPKVVHEKKQILIAPSWQKDNIVDSCLDEILNQLKGHGYQITVRPHPQHVRHMPEKMEQLKQKFANDHDIEIQTDFSKTSNVFEADLMITDWSDISHEFAYTTYKPVLFIDTPMKIMNPEYQNIDTVPINIWVRNEIGMVVELDKLDEIPEKVDYMLNHTEEYHERIDRLVHEYVYHLDESAPYDAQYIIDAVFRKTEERNGLVSEYAENI